MQPSKIRACALPLLALLVTLSPCHLVNLSTYAGALSPIVIGCKQDVEGQVLAEIMAQLLEDRGFAVERRYSLGGTLICLEALKRGSIDVYPEYSGTVEQAILQLPDRVSHAQMRERLGARFQVEMLDFFGFSNTYALAMSRATAERLGLKRIS